MTEPAITIPSPTPPLIHAIDVSAWQGAIDWPAVAASGRRVAFVKASEGATGLHSRDDRLIVNARGASAAGIVTVPYHFFTASDPEEQADNFLAIIDNADITSGPVMLDLERSGSPGSDLGARALVWLAIVEAALGCTAWVYLSPYFAAMQHIERHPELATRPLLLADWQTIVHPEGRTPAPWTEWTGRQTGTAEVPGVRGPCDVDVLRVMP